MPVKLRTDKPDKRLRRIVAALEDYAAAHPRAQIEAYRHGSVSIRIRIIDPTFKGQSRAQREEDLWAILERLPDDVVAEISLLLLYTPEEAKKSFASAEFDDPIPSGLP
jgi:stress-induced morphogen